MAADTKSDSTSEIIEVDLRNPVLAAILAWLWPGAGHLYQRRYAKGVLFMICIVSTFACGLIITDGRAVYASFTPAERRWQFICQAGVGTPAIFAMLQRNRVITRGDEPLLGGYMAPPHPVFPEQDDELAEWHRTYGLNFDMGTLYTMIAGLLNALVICDAYAGPMAPSAEETERGPPKKARKEGDKDEEGEGEPGG